MPRSNWANVLSLAKIAGRKTSNNTMTFFMGNVLVNN
jgi:hypothetical protein